MSTLVLRLCDAKVCQRAELWNFGWWHGLRCQATVYVAFTKPCMIPLPGIVRLKVLKIECILPACPPHLRRLALFWHRAGSHCLRRRLGITVKANLGWANCQNEFLLPCPQTRASLGTMQQIAVWRLQLL